MSRAPCSEGEAMAAFARVVWSAHILKYWTQVRGTKSHKPFKLDPVDDLVDNLDHLDLAETTVEAFDDEDEDEDIYNDVATDANMPLLADSESIRRKFLDHLAQTFSSAKGGPFVTVTALREYEDRVEVDVVRNDGFDDDAEQEDAVYFQGFEHYMNLAPFVLEDEQNSQLDDFETWTIRYSRRRLQSIVHNLIRLLSPYEDLFDDLISNAPTEELVVVFKAVRELSIRENIDDIDSRLESSVKTAFFMVASGEIETVRKMLDTFNIDKVSISGKVERLVYFLARPVVACRHFAKVARTLPHFANIKVIHRQPPAGIQLDTKHVVSLDHAWQQLQLPQFANQEKFMKKFSQRFREDCSRELRVHTEVQLLQLYEAHAHLVPTTKYLGCSKKACLLCETALSQSTLGLVAGKRHGKLYPVWAVPRDALPHFGQRLSELADMIVQRIRLLQTRETEFLEGAIVESTIISDLRSKDLAEIRQRQDFVKTTTSTAEETRLNTALLNRPNTLAQPSGSQATRSRSTWTHKYNELEECVICANRPSTLAQCCESVRYCSDNCRKVDKPGHDLLCEQLQKLDPRPSPIHVRAILLPQDEPKPRWIWVECEQMVEDDGERWEMAQVRPFLGPDKPHIGTTYIQRNAKRCYNLADTIQIQYRDNFLTDGSRANRSLSAALGQLSSMPYKWRGPIVAIRAIGTSDMNRHRDMTLMDLRQTLDLFSSYDDETVVPVESPTITSPSGTTQQPQRSAGHVWGVQVNCTGERRLHGVDEYVAVQIPPHHPTQRPLYPDGDVPSISVLVGLPVRAWRIRDDNAYESRDWKEEGLHYDNRSITFLFQQADPHDQSWGWGWAPPKWNLDTGNVILVKDGGGDLSVREASMLCGFCRDELLDRFEAAMEPEGPLTEERVGRVMGYITRESFGEYMKKRDREDEDDYDYADDDSGDWDYEEMENWGRRR